MRCLAAIHPGGGARGGGGKGGGGTGNPKPMRLHSISYSICRPTHTVIKVLADFGVCDW